MNERLNFMEFTRKRIKQGNHFDMTLTPGILEWIFISFDLLKRIDLLQKSFFAIES